MIGVREGGLIIPRRSVPNATLSTDCLIDGDVHAIKPRSIREGAI
jgi:hypothetical protein